MPGVWRELFPKAIELMNHVGRMISAPVWSFGGGTALMLRIGHRQSKDIDLFVPDPQYLGHVTPRLSTVAESISADYEEGGEYVKLFLAVGEIDVVVGTALTDHPFDLVGYEGQDVRIETSAEIIAKKMWYRGDRAKARDLFDLCAVATWEPEAISAALPFAGRHAAAFLETLASRSAFLIRDFEEIDALGFRMPFNECVELAREIIQPVVQRLPAQTRRRIGIPHRTRIKR
jgi:Nucleotidyl transferase AbiEii toxin, Type IV TA system